MDGDKKYYFSHKDNTQTLARYYGPFATREEAQITGAYHKNISVQFATAEAWSEYEIYCTQIDPSGGCTYKFMHPRYAGYPIPYKQVNQLVAEKMRLLQSGERTMRTI